MNDRKASGDHRVFGLHHALNERRDSLPAREDCEDGCYALREGTGVKAPVGSHRGEGSGQQAHG